jgi:hypothetical protein
VRRSLHMSGPEHDDFLACLRSACSGGLAASVFSEDAELGDDDLLAMEHDDLLALDLLDRLAEEGLGALDCDEALLELLAEEGLDGVYDDDSVFEEIFSSLRVGHPRGQHAPVCGVGGIVSRRREEWETRFKDTQAQAPLDFASRIPREIIEWECSLRTTQAQAPLECAPIREANQGGEMEWETKFKDTQAQAPLDLAARIPREIIEWECNLKTTQALAPLECAPTKDADHFALRREELPGSAASPACDADSVDCATVVASGARRAKRQKDGFGEGLRWLSVNNPLSRFAGGNYLLKQFCGIVICGFAFAVLWRPVAAAFRWHDHQAQVVCGVGARWLLVWCLLVWLPGLQDLYLWARLCRAGGGLLETVNYVDDCIVDDHMSDDLLVLRLEEVPGVAASRASYVAPIVSATAVASSARRATRQKEGFGELALRSKCASVCIGGLANVPRYAHRRTAVGAEGLASCTARPPGGRTQVVQYQRGSRERPMMKRRICSTTMSCTSADGMSSQRDGLFVAFGGLVDAYGTKRRTEGHSRERMAVWP